MIVTGANCGIGKEIALNYANRGKIKNQIPFFFFFLSGKFSFILLTKKLSFCMYQATSIVGLVTHGISFIIHHEVVRQFWLALFLFSSENSYSGFFYSKFQN